MMAKPDTILPGHSAPSQRLADADNCLRADRPLTSQERADLLLWQWQTQRDLPPGERRLIDALVSP